MGVEENQPGPLADRQIQLIVRALADPRRYEILKKLQSCDGVIACGVVRECTEISPATLSHHMRELELAGLVESVRHGKFVSYRLNRELLKAFLSRVGEDLT